MGEWAAAGQLLQGASNSHAAPSDARSAAYGSTVGGISEGAWNVSLNAPAAALIGSGSGLLQAVGLAVAAGLVVALYVKWARKS